eukprot:CAMPEP_0180173554 /NCGR_PEP_ID=MMETSP0986-20121125/35644_1 /TAXON_ID=697907 /ORGANISM="non described non described, Strain CCMP2293" /LENGTH=39 /DNA_ID= /DNA_START= /DNA_END= /DNA_ORIENTATION=
MATYGMRMMRAPPGWPPLDAAELGDEEMLAVQVHFPVLV